MHADEATIREKMLAAWRFLYKRGFIEGFGHISARLAGSGQFLLTRHSLGLRATPDDLIRMDPDGRKLAGQGDPPGEFPIEENAHRAWVSAALGAPVWLDEETVAAAAEKLMGGRRPFRRVWAMVESDTQ